MASVNGSLLSGGVDAAASAPVLTGVVGAEIVGAAAFNSAVLTGVPGTLLTYSAGAPPDLAPPVVGNFVPPPGSAVTRLTPVAFDVTDDSGAFRTLLVAAHYPATGVTELVHDGIRFRGSYATSSLRTMIASGFRYVILRSGGWPDAPTIETFAVDPAGNEVR